MKKERTYRVRFQYKRDGESYGIDPVIEARVWVKGFLQLRATSKKAVRAKAETFLEQEFVGRSEVKITEVTLK